MKVGGEIEMGNLGNGIRNLQPAKVREEWMEIAMVNGNGLE